MKTIGFMAVATLLVVLGGWLRPFWDEWRALRNEGNGGDGFVAIPLDVLRNLGVTGNEEGWMEGIHPSLFNEPDWGHEEGHNGV